MSFLCKVLDTAINRTFNKEYELMSTELLELNGTLFPPYLNQGSEGHVVGFLQGLLQCLGIGEDVIRDGIYGEKTAAAVKVLQRMCSLPQDQIDGNFGPVTRRGLKESFGIDVSLMPYNPRRDGETKFCSPEFDGQRYWDGFGDQII